MHDLGSRYALFFLELIAFAGRLQMKTQILDFSESVFCEA